MNRRSDHKGKPANASEVVRRQGVWLLIDGYNLMHVTRFKPLGQAPGELRRCRDGLLSLLSQQLSSQQYREITVVFDANYAPSHLADEIQHRHIRAVFARNENSADDLIAKLVQQHTSAKKLIVVSSDHRVQNAGRRRKATVIDANDWFDAVLDYEPQRETSEEPPRSKEAHDELSEEQLAEFKAEMMRTKKSDADRLPSHDGQNVPEEIENPFPEGYFDDLEDLDDY